MNPVRYRTLTKNCADFQKQPHSNLLEVDATVVPLTSWLLSVLFLSFSSVIKPDNLFTVNEKQEAAIKQEAAKQKAELKRQRTERQKLKKTIRSSDDDEDELNERPNTTVCPTLL
jgi:septal ring factor EnvC (AmiA/AmiB activator)